MFPISFKKFLVNQQVHDELLWESQQLSDQADLHSAALKKILVDKEAQLAEARRQLQAALMEWKSAAQGRELGQATGRSEKEGDNRGELRERKSSAPGRELEQVGGRSKEKLLGDSGVLTGQGVGQDEVMRIEENGDGDVIQQQVELMQDQLQQKEKYAFMCVL